MAFIIPYTVFNIYDLNTVTTNSDDAARHRLIDLSLEFILYILLCMKMFSEATSICSYSDSYELVAETT